MSHGAPDFFQYRRDSASFPIGDLAELAARLGAPVWYDQRGDIFWWDSFEHGLRDWAPVSTPGGGSLTLDTTTVRHGGFAMQLLTPGSGADTIYASRSDGLLTTSRLGIELHWLGASELTFVTLRQVVHNGSRQTRYQVRFDIATGTIEYEDDDGNWQAVASGLGLAIDPSTWHASKIVIDPATQTYVRFLHDNLSYDLTGTDANDRGASTEFSIQTEVQATGDAADSWTLNIDQITLTRDEPA